MVLPAIVRALRPTTLQVLCAVGFFHGISMFVYTIRQRRRHLTRPDSSATKTPDVNRDLIAKQVTRPRASSLQVIHLSPRTGTLRVSNMTQQQKIAAALLKAGSSNSPSWHAPDLYESASESSVQVITALPPTSTGDDGPGRADTHGDAATQPSWKINLMFCVSSALTILSLCFFLKSLR